MFKYMRHGVFYIGNYDVEISGQIGLRRRGILPSMEWRFIVKKETIIRITKYLLDFMFFAGMAVTVSLPLSVKWIGSYLEGAKEHYVEYVLIYFVLGVLAVAILGELRKMFRTVLADDCFVMENVVSLQRMGTYSFMIALMALVRTVVCLTIAMLIVILVFLIAGLFSKTLAFVFDKAVQYKEENDLTI